MEIRPAKTDNLDDIVEIWKDFMDYHKAIDSFFSRAENGHNNFRQFLKSILEDDNYLILVAMSSEKTIGYALAQVSNRPPVFENTKYCLLTDIVLVEDFRGKGVGQKLLEKVTSWAKENGINRIELKVAPGNKLGYDFYKKNGFKEYLYDLYINL